jgi:hypothetical protein
VYKVHNVPYLIFVTFTYVTPIHTRNNNANWATKKSITFFPQNTRPRYSNPQSSIPLTETRAARFFSVQHTKTGKNIPKWEKLHQNSCKRDQTAI